MAVSVTKGSGRYFWDFQRVYTETRDTGVQPFWVGKLPSWLNLPAQPNPQLVQSMCDGRAYLPHVQQNRVGCYDVTVSFGKSVSLLAYGLTPPKEQKAWTETFARVTAPEIEKLVNDQRINFGPQGKQKVQSQGVAVGFCHRESYRGQDQAHIHFAVINLSTDGIGTVRSIAGVREGLYEKQGVLNARVQKSLDDDLQAKGFETVRIGKNVELAKVPKALRDELSPARQAMNVAREEKGFSGPRAMDFYARQARKDSGPRVQLYPGEGRMRWFVVDPTNAYLPLLYQVVPGDVPIIRATPVDAEGWRWDVRRDITSASLNEALQEGLFPESLFQKAGDPFWYTKAREVAQAVVTVYQERGSGWEFHDLIMPFRYPQFLAHLLKQSPMTKGMAEHELVGRLGRDIISTASSIMNKMAIAAALWQKAERSFSLGDFLDDRAVMHFAYTPDLIPSFAGIANALVRVMVLLGISRIDPYNHTLLWLDEGRYLADLAGLEDLAARGRGAGFGAVFAAQGLPGLVNKWGKGRVDELVDLLSTWVALASGPETAEMFSRAVGKCEGVSRSYSISHTYGESITKGGNRGQSSSWSFSGPTTYGSNSGTSWSTTTNWSRSESESFQLTVRDAVMAGELTNLPYADAVQDRISGFAFNPQVGAFEFAAPFLRHFRELPDPIVGTMPLRPEGDQRLLPWKEEDVTRLKLDATPELIAAIKKTWEAFGGGR